MEEDEIVEDEHDGIDASSEDGDSDDGDDSSSSDESDDDEYDKVIKIPIQDSDEFVVFYTYELPDDVEEVLELLRVCQIGMSPFAYPTFVSNIEFLLFRMQ